MHNLSFASEVDTYIDIGFNILWEFYKSLFSGNHYRARGAGELPHIVYNSGECAGRYRRFNEQSAQATSKPFSCVSGQCGHSGGHLDNPFLSGQ